MRQLGHRPEAGLAPQTAILALRGARCRASRLAARRLDLLVATRLVHLGGASGLRSGGPAIRPRHRGPDICLGTALGGFDVISEHVIAGQELLLQVEGELVLLALQDDIAGVQQLYLGGALEAPATDLGDLSQALDNLPVVAAVEDVIDELQHVDAVALQEVVHVGAQQLLQARQ